MPNPYPLLVDYFKNTSTTAKEGSSAWPNVEAPFGVKPSPSATVFFDSVKNCLDRMPQNRADHPGGISDFLWPCPVLFFPFLLLSFILVGASMYTVHYNVCLLLDWLLEEADRREWLAEEYATIRDGALPAGRLARDQGIPVDENTLAHVSNMNAIRCSGGHSVARNMEKNGEQ